MIFWLEIFECWLCEIESLPGRTWSSVSFCWAKSIRVLSGDKHDWSVWKMTCVNSLSNATFIFVCWLYCLNTDLYQLRIESLNLKCVSCKYCALRYSQVYCLAPLTCIYYDFIFCELYFTKKTKFTQYLLKLKQ